MTVQASRGQATISLVLLIGGIAAGITLAVALITLSLIGTGYGAEQMQRARSAALAGIEDGVLRITRNPADTGTYTVSSGTATATVTIYSDKPVPGASAIYSEATVGLRRSSLYGIFALDPLTGIPTPVSLNTQ